MWVNSERSKRLTDLESMTEYLSGLWKTPYVKIYSMGNGLRVAEVSNYPRAYKDTEHHIYTVDTPFTVTESDLNWIDEAGNRVYQDYNEKNFQLGEKAIHLTGEALPGIYPVWLSSENLPFKPNLEQHEFDLSSIPGFPKSSDFIYNIEIKKGPAFTQISASEFALIKPQIASKKISLTREIADNNKQIMRILYRRAT